MASLPVKPLPSGHLQLHRRNLIIPPSMITVGFKRHHFLGVSSNDESVRHMRSLRSSSNRRPVSKSAGVSMPVASSDDFPAVSWESWKPEKTTVAPSLSDVIWPAAGAFAAMAIMGRIDQMLNPRGISMSVAPLGAVSAILFITPSSPAARKYNMFTAQIGCAAIGVLAFSVFGPGWLARSTALAASIAFMVITRANHPPAASLPLLFIDGAKLHKLNFWYALFPGAAACILLCFLQEIVCYLKENFKF
ncbi:HPP family [Arabidopsis thaliana x Arabidopsis arenosa]|uniref:HPP family n=1 Tax=Arabidopsis thaliana x Arabidopsis arenosa TaxID=1240361 RepID=A0A8T1ZPE9_9BRAS|nr:HPP family [Arabidopsis thaliana x Arabidopsis arenosa]